MIDRLVWKVNGIQVEELCFFLSESHTRESCLTDKIDSSMWNKVISVTLLYYIYSLWDNGVNCATINDTKTLTANLLSDYSINVRPVADQSQSVNVSVQPYIKSIQEFDEVQGKLSFVGALFISWHDASMIWDPSLYGGVYEVVVLYPNVWIPELVLSSPSDDVDSLGHKWNRIRFLSNGVAMWLPVDLIESTCSVNVRNYPFDTQECLTSFNCFGYNTYEVRLVADSTEFDLEFYQHNSMWTLKKTKVSTSESGGGSQIDLVLYLDRKPSFVIINVVMPILFLSLLNVLVFLLIPESGERVSYCITVLLAVAVFMTIVSDMLPRSSEPVPVISFKLMADMAISSFIVLFTIVNLKLYYREDSVPVPAWLRALHRTLSCVCCNKKKIQPALADFHQIGNQHDNAHAVVKTINVEEFGKKVTNVKGSTKADVKVDEPVTWRKISVMMDYIALVGFSAASLASFLLFMAVTSVSPD